MDDSECAAQQLFDRSDPAAIERPEPAEVIGQVARRDAMETGQPLLEPPMVGVHVLDVNGAVDGRAHPFACLKIDCLVRDFMIAGEGPVGGIGVGDQQRLRRQLRQKVLDELGCFQGAAAGDGIDGMPAAVARDQDAIEMARNARQGGLASTLARLAVELARALLRLEKKRLVGLDDTSELRGPVVLDPFEEAVAPAKCGVAVNADPLGGGAHRERVQQRAEIIWPFLFPPEARQRRPAQVVEGTAAFAAAKTLQVVGVAMPVPMLALAAGTAASSRSDLADEGDDPVESGSRMQGCEHDQPLRLVEKLELGEQLREPWRLHDLLLSTTIGVGPWISSAVHSVIPPLLEHAKSRG